MKFVTPSLVKLFEQKLLSIAILTSLSFAPVASQASGLFLQEAVIANAGTTGAGDGVYTDSAAAMWTNPATMSYMGESLTTFNTLAFDLKMDYTHTGDFALNDGSAQSYLPSFAAFHAHQLNEDLHLGLAFGAAGGSSLDYGNRWAGAVNLESITLNVIQLNPSLSFKVTDQWSWGLGAQMSWAGLEQTSLLLDVKQGTDWAFGFNAGVMYQHTNDLDFGVSFRSKIEHDFKTGASFANQSRTLSTDISVPAILDFSSRWGVNDELNLLASIQLHRWSEWDQSTFDLSGNVVALERDWDDVWKLALGADYRLNSDWRLKAGFSYETSPQDDPTKQWVDLPVGEQYRYSVGASTQWDDVTIDMFYEYADLGSIDSAKRANGLGVNGTFDGRIHFVGVNFTF